MYNKLFLTDITAHLQGDFLIVRFGGADQHYLEIDGLSVSVHTNRGPDSNLVGLCGNGNGDITGKKLLTEQIESKIDINPSLL